VSAVPQTRVGLRTVLREWGRIGVIGFGGPPAHVALLRRLCVDERRWIDDRTFTDANAACGLLPGPASTQLAIFCAHRVGGPWGAVVGGLAFIVPGLVLLLGLAAISLSDAPPDAVRGASAAAGAAVVAVVAQAGVALVRPTVRSLRGGLYLLLGAVATLAVGPYVVLVLLGCGLVELALRTRTAAASLSPVGVLLVVTGVSALPALAWTAFQVGALSYGGGFVIIPLMQGEAVDRHGWMTQQEFLNAVALGQITPGPVVQTVGAVGYAAAGLGGGILAAVVAFAPSFLVILLGGERFERLRTNRGARAFLDGAGPAAVGAILGASLLLLGGVQEPWQWALLAAAAVALFVLRAGLVVVLLGAAAIGLVLGIAGAPLP
jgi:chromate transporter